MSKGDDVHLFRSSFIEAFRKWYAIVGTVVAALSLVHIAVGAFTLDLGAFGTALVETYRAIIHAPISYLLSLLGVTVPPLAIDLAIIWLVNAGAIFRILMAFRSRQAAYHGIDGRTFLTNVKIILGYLNPLFMWRSHFVRHTTETGVWAIAVLCLLSWPGILASFFYRPYVAEHDQPEGPISLRAEMTRHRSTLYDQRWVYVSQLGAATLIAVLIVAMNTQFIATYHR